MAYTNPTITQFQAQFTRDFPFQYSVETLTFSDISASGQFVINWNGLFTAPILWNDTVLIIQAKIQALPGCAQVTVTGSIATQMLVFNFIGVVPPAATITISSNTLANASSAPINITILQSYPGNPNTQVLDTDISNAFVFTNQNINQALFCDQTSYTLGYNLLSAHYLVTNLRSSSQGINGQYNFLQASKGVGSVNEAFNIPERILANPYWSMLTKTNYGATYLQLLLPQLTGQVYNVYGTTLP